MEYYTETVNIPDRWSIKRQRERADSFRAYLNQTAGGQAGRLVSNGSVPLTGHFTGKVRDYACLTFFKRQIS